MRSARESIHCSTILMSERSNGRAKSRGASISRGASDWLQGRRGSGTFRHRPRCCTTRIRQGAVPLQSCRMRRQSRYTTAVTEKPQFGRAATTQEPSRLVIGRPIRRLHQRRADDDRRVIVSAAGSGTAASLGYCCRLATKAGTGPREARARAVPADGGEINIRIANAPRGQYFHLSSPGGPH